MEHAVIGVHQTIKLLDGASFVFRFR